MKTIINNLKKENLSSIIALTALIVACVSIVVLVAFCSNGVYSTDFVVGY